MATTADFRNGLCIEHNGELWTIVEFQHVKPITLLKSLKSLNYRLYDEATQRLVGFTGIKKKLS